MPNCPIGQVNGSDLCTGEENVRLTMVSVMLVVSVCKLAKKRQGLVER